MLTEIDREKQSLESFNRISGLHECTGRCYWVRRRWSNSFADTAAKKPQYRALAQLERPQSQRGGEAIPSPLQVHINTAVEDCAKRSQQVVCFHSSVAMRKSPCMRASIRRICNFTRYENRFANPTSCLSFRGRSDEESLSSTSPTSYFVEYFHWDPASAATALRAGRRDQRETP